MYIRFNEKALEKIEKNYDVKHREKFGRFDDMGITINNSIGGSTIFNNNWMICKVEEINSMIEHLTILKAAIEEETGLQF